MKKIFLTSLLLISLMFVITACDSEEYTSEEEIIDTENLEHDFEEILDEELEDELTKDLSDSTTKHVSIKELYDKGTPLHCTYEGYDEEGHFFELNVYIDKERYKTHTAMSFEGEEIESTMIFDENVVYTWSSEADFGMKLDISMFEEQESEDETIDTSEEYSFECKSWHPTNEVFNIPSNIEFMELGGMFEGLVE